jgi:hypothetical protein
MGDEPVMFDVWQQPVATSSSLSLLKCSVESRIRVGRKRSISQQQVEVIWNKEWRSFGVWRGGEPQGEAYVGYFGGA